MSRTRSVFPLLLGIGLLASACHKSTKSGTPVIPPPASAGQSVARQWNEILLQAIRDDFARPTVHARNLFHTSIAMWDAWAAYDTVAKAFLAQERHTADDVKAARNEAISYAAYRVLTARFAGSPSATKTLAALDAKMKDFGYDANFVDTVGNSPAAVGNRIGIAVLQFGTADGANETNGYANKFYQPVNKPLIPVFPGNPELVFPNRWQPLSLKYNIDQSGKPLPVNVVPFLSPEWGQCTPFSLTKNDLTINQRDGFDYWVYHDPGPPPEHLVGPDYQTTFEVVLDWSSKLDPTDGVMIDISPASRGNNTLGTNDGHGRGLNPFTGKPYTPQKVNAGDYFRVLAEFWADGPDSETPPGHWFVIANYVSDHPAMQKRFRGRGELLDPLEWDVKLYIALSGAVHDVAVSAWGIKGWYDYIRPISALRFMGDLGQRTDSNLPNYNPGGIQLVPGRVELVTEESVKPGQRHYHLAEAGPASVVGKIAVRAWRGPDYIKNPDVDVAGVGWILLENWWPYQRPTFVTPPFAGYVSGHSTFSRCAATVLTMFTGTEYFPGGMGEFHAKKNEFLVFEEGPSMDVVLQWATYYDAADECSLSRIYGGIHPPADDIPGRKIGAKIGPEAFQRALELFGVN